LFFCDFDGLIFCMGWIGWLFVGFVDLDIWMRVWFFCLLDGDWIVGIVFPLGFGLWMVFLLMGRLFVFL